MWSNLMAGRPQIRPPESRIVPKLQRAGALQDAGALSPSAAMRAASWSAAGLRRFGMRSRLLTKTTMVRSRVPAVCASLATFANTALRDIIQFPTCWQYPSWAKAPEGWSTPGRWRVVRKCRDARSVLECGGSPPLWNAFPLANQSCVGSFCGAVCLRELGDVCQYSLA